MREAIDEASSSNRQAAADAKAFRRQLNKTQTYNRRTFNDEASLQRMEADGVGYSRSGLVAQVCMHRLRHCVLSYFCNVVHSTTTGLHCTMQW